MEDQRVIFLKDDGAHLFMLLDDMLLPRETVFIGMSDNQEVNRVTFPAGATLPGGFCISCNNGVFTTSYNIDPLYMTGDQNVTLDINL